MPVTEGVDYAWNGPSAAALAVAGKHFAVRYGGPGSAGKQLTAPVLARLRAAGLDVVANAEGAAGGFRGATAGASWARQAVAHFGPLGMPAGRPIYFSVDWDAQPSDWNAIDDALRGAASVIGAGAVGVYGSYDTVAHCSAAGTARWFWQTYAWSGGRWHPACHLQQYRNGVTIAGADCDLTRAVRADYGQWGFTTTTPEDDVTEAELIAAVNKALAAYFAAKPEGADGMNESVIGKLAWKQPVPNPLRTTTDPDTHITTTPRTMAYQLLADVASVAGQAPTATQTAAAVLAELGVSDLESAAAALRTAFGSRAAQLGALLQS